MTMTDEQAIRAVVDAVNQHSEAQRQEDIERERTKAMYNRIAQLNHEFKPAPQMSVQYSEPIPGLLYGQTNVEQDALINCGVADLTIRPPTVRFEDTGSPLFKATPPHISLPDIMERLAALEARMQSMELLHTGAQL